jgi:type IV secretion system protein VirD4
VRSSGRAVPAPGLYLGETAAGPLVAGPEQGVLVLGPPRSGKTSGLVVPNVLAAAGAVLSTSTKHDVLHATLAARASVGTCWLYDPTGSVECPAGVEPLRWSPVSSALSWDGAVLMARSIVQSARPGRGLEDATHWTERAEALLAPLLHAAAQAGADMEAVVTWTNRRTAAEAEDVLAVEGSPAAADLLAGVLASEDRELSGIWSTASSVLAGYRLDAARASAADPNFDPAQFVAGRDTVYVCASGRQQALIAPLVVGLVEDVRAATYARAADAARANKPAGAAVVLALDEVATIAPLPELPSIVADGGGQGLITLACLQDLSQARARWGPMADGFGSLFASTVVLPGIGDVRTLQALSARCGEIDVPVRSESRGAGRRRHRSGSVSWSTRRQPRLGVEEIANGRPGAALVVGGTPGPVWVEVTPWWIHRRWRSLASPPVAGAALERPPSRASRQRGRQHDQPTGLEVGRGR